MKRKKLKKLFSTSLLVLFSSVVGAWTSGYYSTYQFGKKLEETKSELILEQKLIDLQLKTVEDLSVKAGQLFQYSSLYRKYELVPEKSYPNELNALVKTMGDQSFSSEAIEEIQRDFHVALFASKPFIDEDVYTQLVIYAKWMNHFNYDTAEKPSELHEKYETAGKSYNKALKLIRERYYREI
ncbi:MAG: hypothetical protein ACI93R_003760 [Flavobacteriales bacterium]|jgi:hypothetical protein